MASELPTDMKRLPKWVPLRGPFLGIFVLFAVLAVMLSNFKVELNKETEFIFVQTGIILCVIVGGGMGGLIQLKKAGRAQDIPRFFRVLFIFVLRYFLMFAFPTCLAVWIGHRFLGPWLWVAYAVCAVLVGFLTVLDDRWSSRKKPSPPPA